MFWSDLSWKMKYFWMASYPNLDQFSLDTDNFLKWWHINGGILAMIVAIQFIVFYWFTRPDVQALKRFWVNFGISWLYILVVAATPVSFLIEKKELSDKIGIYLTSIIAAGYNLIIVYFIIALLLFLLNLLPIPKGNLKAMRRYPFSWIK